MLPIQVRLKLSFSFATVISAAARALLMSAVSDDVDGGVRNPAFLVSAFPAEPKSSSFGCNWHNSLMRSMLAKVVKSFPAMRSMTRRPRAPSRRSPAAVIEPSGNAITAAISNRSGVSDVTFSGGGIDAMAQQHM
jgi:hypothetical protein